ncbi:MAG: secondary thiamine-phosphate synthase enzyme YjbQ [Candidatus Omnitrophica bacterium]|nr:secondary thiamine-phosphate synthase enzyme YjbQ [Candidatus Omnitrophota bacterium]MDD5429450.1 secondary thiamine-phosphate synthase enzyme YjbQ [Candidatus Omnitrophota bacterium]
MKVLQVSTKKKTEFIDITTDILRVISGKGAKSGLCCVFCPHTTAALTINENADPAVIQDILAYLGKAIPSGKNFSHQEGNSDAHIKSSLFGNSLMVIIKGGQLKLGTWQGIYFCEFDGPRTRQVYVKTIDTGRRACFAEDLSRRG